ncbi:MAG: hypothetical protein IJP62_05865 [Treponema sp.]|nr:hypothetical protein [Treponema sp.]
MDIEKDLHSVYIDNELPPAYIEKYESLVQSDVKCAAEQARMKKLHALLQEDADDITVDDAFLEASFARLQTKLKYHQHTAATQESKPKIYQFTRWGVSFAAAAAVFALIFTPVYIRSASNAQNTTVNAITNTKLKPLAQNNITMDGNFGNTTLFSLAVNDSTAIQGATTASTATKSAYPQKTHSINLNDSLTSIDVFRPASANADNGLSIHISISPMSAVPGEEEIIVPLPNFFTTQAE